MNLEDPLKHLRSEAISAHIPENLSLRETVLTEKQKLREDVRELTEEVKGQGVQSPEKQRAFRAIQAKLDAQDQLETLLSEEFIPQHGARQLISPRAFFASPLFRVCSKRLERAREMSLELCSASGQALLRYQGPELRQSDGFVFMALLNLSRDHRVGESVSFEAETLCKTVFGRYDGPARKQLKDHIKRLQRGLVEFDEFSVQLCGRFESPSRGAWSVVLDRDIVKLFQKSTQVWLDLSHRQQLPEGLSTWLYAFVESQSRLIPMKLGTLKQLCGSDATDESFLRTLRIAVKELVAQGVLDSGWRLEKGVLYWMKARSAVPEAVS